MQIIEWTLMEILKLLKIPCITTLCWAGAWHVVISAIIQGSRFVDEQNSFSSRIPDLLLLLRDVTSPRLVPLGVLRMQLGTVWSLFLNSLEWKLCTQIVSEKTFNKILRSAQIAIRKSLLLLLVYAMEWTNLGVLYIFNKFVLQLLCFP